MEQTPAMPERPQVIAFDVVETLFSLEPVRKRIEGLGLPGDALEHWFAGFLRDVTPLVARVFSIDEVRRWKPFPEPYLHAAAELELRPGQLAMVAVHARDVHGAKQAGLVTGWADRLEGRWNTAMTPPDVTGSTLVEVVQGLLG
jgi:FMN phosphatase YigB (HAD superfamily)